MFGQQISDMLNFFDNGFMRSIFQTTCKNSCCEMSQKKECDGDLQIVPVFVIQIVIK